MLLIVSKYSILRLAFFVDLGILIVDEWLVFKEWLLIYRVVVVTRCWFHVLWWFQVVKFHTSLTMLLLWILWVTIVTDVCIIGCTFKHDLLLVILYNLLRIRIILMSLLVNNFNSFLFYRSLLLDNAVDLLTITVLIYTYSWVYLALHLLVFSFALYLFPVCRFVCLVSNLLWLLMWLTVLVRIDSISIVNG